MAASSVGAFAAGFALGWVGRSFAGSTRGLLVDALVVAHGVRDRVRRVLFGQLEWAEDIFAEGRARYAATQTPDTPSGDERTRRDADEPAQGKAA